MKSSTCATGKVCFPSRKEGLRALNHQRRSFNKWGNHGTQGDGAVSVYRCPHCLAWHMTSKRYGVRRR